MVAEGQQTYVVSYGYVPDMEQRRTPHREAHLKFLRAAGERGELLLAGALTDPVDGGLLVVVAESAGAARAWVDGDPYAAAGLVRSVTIRPITLVVGAPGS